jgi:leucyl-tRNA synthetase
VNPVVLSLADRRSTAVTLRCREYADFLGRLRAIGAGREFGQGDVVVTGAADPAGALAGLARAAVVTSDEPRDGEATPTVRYVPSRAARERVGEETDGSWPQSVASRQRKVIRRTPGAIFLFPMEAAGEVPIEVFITDWSPSPAACAIAVHPAHPLSRGATLREGVGFTGRYCRHPLTGDLLPIWVAPWVKPEFGSGAVLVNPGHDKVDLAFGREVGLPIRFSLAPAGYDGAPSGWLTPPVIKTGVAVRTGATDGLAFDAARAEYFRILVERELATTYTDFGAGSFAVASFSDEGTAKIGWDPRRRTVAEAEEETEAPVRLAFSPVMAAAEAAVRSAALTVVAPSTSIETDVLAVRLMLAEPGLEPAVSRSPDVVLVGAVAGQTEAADPAVLRLTLVGAADALDTLSVKAQQLEASQRFLETHGQIDGLTEVPAGDAGAEVAKSAGQIKELLHRGDTKQAFTQLYRLQKSVAKGSGVTRGDVLAYQALAWVLSGAPVGCPEADLAAAWARI